MATVSHSLRRRSRGAESVRHCDLYLAILTFAPPAAAYLPRCMMNAPVNPLPRYIW